MDVSETQTKFNHQNNIFYADWDDNPHKFMNRPCTLLKNKPVVLSKLIMDQYEIIARLVFCFFSFLKVTKIPSMIKFIKLINYLP